jgi:hypothetical protein
MYGNQKQQFCSQLFLHVVFRAKTAGTEQTGCLPERAKRSGATEQAAHRSSRKYARFKLRSNVASLGANSLNALGRTTSESPLRPESDRQ